MPNHISQKLTVEYKENVEGSYEKASNGIKKIIEKMKSDNSDFDFNNLIPMPEELKNTTSPARIVSEEEYPKKVKEIDKANKKNKHWQQSYPLTQKMSDDLIKKYGYNNWYDWANANWDTKWGAYEVSIAYGSEILFQTAWSISMPILEKLSKEFPNIVLKLEYADEDSGRNCGIVRIKNGSIISHENDRNIEDKDWIEFANRLYWEVEAQYARKERDELQKKLNKKKNG